MKHLTCIAGLTVAAIVAATAIEARTEALGKIQYRHPVSGVLLPPEPLCCESVHYKTDPGPKEPAPPFRQKVIDAPTIDSIPPIDAPILKGDAQ